MTAKTKVKINDKEIYAVIDTGAATNLITNRLQKELGLKIIDKSDMIFIMANGKRSAALGKIRVKMEIKGRKIPMELQVIESQKKDLLIGMETFLWLEANLDFKRKEMKLVWNNKEIVTKILCTKRELDDEIKRIKELGNEEEEYEEYNESPAYYLAKLTNDI